MIQCLQAGAKNPLEAMLALPSRRITKYFEAVAQIAVMIESSSPVESQRLHQIACSWNDLSTIANTHHVSAEVLLAHLPSCSSSFPAHTCVLGGELALAQDHGHAHPSHAQVNQDCAAVLCQEHGARCGVHNALQRRPRRLACLCSTINRLALTLHQLFSTVQHSLATLWVDSIPDTDTVKCAFSLTMPEEKIVLAASSEVDKEDWISTIVQAIAALVDGDDGQIVTMKSGQHARLFASTP